MQGLGLSMQKKIFLKNVTLQAGRRPSWFEGPCVRQQHCRTFTRVLHPPPPRGYWTIKQKPLLLSMPAIATFRPIIAHRLHPCRAVLRRIGWSLSLPVALAIVPVKERHLAFTTDDDRQGESWGVCSWPLPDKPRARSLLPALLAGLTAEIRFYTVPGVAGYTETVRKMYAVLPAR